MDTEILKEFVELDKEKSDLEARLDVVKQRKADISISILDSMIDAGIDQIKMHGRTIFIHSQTWAKIESTKEEVINALKEANLSEYVVTGYNSQSLSAYVRNQIESGEPLPEALKGHISADKKTSVRSK